MIKSGELCEVEKLVEKLGSEILSARDKHGYTPAHWAALDGNVEIMRYLVERNAPVDLPCLGTQGPRPIHWVSTLFLSTIESVKSKITIGRLVEKDTRLLFKYYYHPVYLLTQ